MRTATALLLVALALALASCSDDAPPTPTTTQSATREASTTPEVTPTLAAEPSPTSTWTPPPPVVNRPGEPSVAPGTDYPTVGLDAEGLPLATEGSLVVYAKELRSGSQVEVVVFDLARGERLTSFPIGSNFRLSAQLAGTRVIVSFGSKLWSYALDGSDGLLLDDELTLSYILPSPDGRYLAATGSDRDLPTAVAIFDVETGDRLVDLHLLEVMPDWLGEPHPVRWLPDGNLLVGGLCHCDGSPGGYFDVVVSIDAEVTRAADDLRSPGPIEAQIADAFDVSCVLGGFAGGRTVQIVDVTTGAVLAEATEDAPIFTGASLSPDGSEALVTTLVAGEQLRAMLNDALTDGHCIDSSELPNRPPDLSVLTIATGELQPAPSLIELFERWYDPLPIFVCDGEERAGADTSNWLDPAPWRSPVGFGAPSGFTSEACQRGRVSVDMRIETTVVDTDAEGYRILGFIDPTS
jgi:hypothetical protein